MKSIVLLFFSVTMSCNLTWAQLDSTRINTAVDTVGNSGLIMRQSFETEAPIDMVWAAYTTKKGWESWAVPLAEVDLKINGAIKTNYNPQGQIGDSATIVLHILNFIPQKLITLQAGITNNFPQFMQDEADDFYNIITFEKTENGGTKVISYGLGYKNEPRYHKMMHFFVKGNEQSLLQLLKYLEGE
ncbi:MAG TPA: hypothetical protein DDY13_13050 [Cytophagales bacterium]|jgi:uncharacterized protein YndB with AHSA1/START domain|nr:hypothetical protein [Cytophagales bacterium]